MLLLLLSFLQNKVLVAIKITQIEEGRVGFSERGTGLSDAAESVGGNWPDVSVFVFVIVFLSE